MFRDQRGGEQEKDRCWRRRTLYLDAATVLNDAAAIRHRRLRRSAPLRNPVEEQAIIDLYERALRTHACSLVSGNGCGAVADNGGFEDEEKRYFEAEAALVSAQASAEKTAISVQSCSSSSSSDSEGNHDRRSQLSASLIGMPRRPTPVLFDGDADRNRRERRYAQSHEDDLVAVIVHNIAILHLDMDRPNAAIKFFRLLLHHAHNSEIQAGGMTEALEMTALGATGLVHYIGENYAEAARYAEAHVDACRDALDRVRSLASPSSVADPNVNLLVPAMVRLGGGMVTLARCYAHGHKCHDASVVIREASALAEAASEFVAASSSLGADDNGALEALEDLLDNAAYVEALVYHHGGEYRKAAGGYRACLTRCSVRKRCPSLLREGGPPRPIADSAALAARSAAAMHGLSHCLLHLSSSSAPSSSSSAKASVGSRRVAIMSLTIRRAILGDDHRDTAETLFLLGDILSEAEEWADALDLYRRAATIWTNCLGENHIHVLKAICNVAVVHRERNELPEALATCRTVIGRGLAVVSRTLLREVLVFEGDLMKEMEAVGVGRGGITSNSDGDRDSKVLKGPRKPKSGKEAGERCGEWCGRVPDAAAA